MAKFKSHADRRPKQGRRPDFPRLLGGNLALDLVNTVEDRAGLQQDLLRSHVDLAKWGEHAGLLSTVQAVRLAGQAVQSPNKATAYLKRVVALREAVYRIFLAIAQGESPDEGDLRLLKAQYLEGLKKAQLSSTVHGFHWEWDPNTLETIGWRIAKAGMDLLSSEELERIRECPNCGWLFVDESKNSSRRWCSMEGCGSQVKARRQYARKHPR